jgi:hypothetical protein
MNWENLNPYGLLLVGWRRHAAFHHVCDSLKGHPYPERERLGHPKQVAGGADMQLFSMSAIS